MRKNLIFFLLIFSFIFCNKCMADDIVPSASIVRTSSNLYDFSRTYKISSENLLYLLLSAINEQNYSIEEIQFKTGSVLFKAAAKEFIALVSSKDGYNSFVKIAPVDNSYNFSPVVIQKLHTYIEANNTSKFQKVL